MLTLEHLVQHYMKFSDGLPMKLRYPVAPKPKPPLPPTSAQDPTLKVKSSCHKLLKSVISRATTSGQSSNEGSCATLIGRERKLSKDADVSPKMSSQMRERNLSLPSDDLMNQVGLSSPTTISMNSLPPLVDSTSPMGTKPKKSPKKPFSPNFLSLKLPKKSNKTKSKSTNDNIDNASHLLTNDQISKTFSSLSFTSDIIADINDDSVYNIPSNIPVSRIDDNQNHSTLSSAATLPMPARRNSNRKDSHSDFDYMDKFTQSDKQIGAVDETHDKDNSIEEIYFVEAPTKVMSINYVAFKQVPFFPSSNSLADTSNNNAINNNSLVNNNAITNLSTRAERVLSVESTLSNDLDLMLALQNQGHLNGNTASPNYYIPSSSIELDNVLGQGEFGSVYKGQMRCETQNGESQKIPVAIKTLLDEHCKENRIEFLREASVMIKLSHHCIVKMIGISKVCLNCILEMNCHSLFGFFFLDDCLIGAAIDDCTRVSFIRVFIGLFGNKS